MRGIVLAAALAACRAGFDELPPETPEPVHVDPDRIGEDRDPYEAMVLWYELDEVSPDKAIPDASGNDRHGKCRATCPTITDGFIEAAADFATTTLVDTPKLEIDDMYTVAGWLWLPDVAAPTAPPCMVRELAGTPVWRVCASKAAVWFTTGTHTLAVTASIPTQDWVHIAVRWDRTKKTIYLDGVEHASAVAQNTPGPAQIAVGGADVNVDDFRIYARALTHVEIASLYTQLD